MENEASELTRSSVYTWQQIQRWLSEDSLEALIYIGAAVAIYFLFVLIRAGLRKVVGQPSEHNPYNWRGILAGLLAKTRSFFLAMSAAKIVAEVASAPSALLSVIDFFYTVALVIQGAIWVREIVLALITRKASDPHADKSTLASAMGVIRLLINIAVWAFALILILDNLGIDVTALIAGLGVGGIAIGLAAQGIFSDLFAALSILFDKPFKRGDTINFAQTTGTVEAIGLKTTRIRALDGEEVIVSNANLLNDNIRNFASYQRRRVILQIGVIYQTPVEVLAKLQDEIKAIVDGQEGCTFDRAHIWNFGASSIDIELMFHSDSDDYSEMMQRRHEIMIKLVGRFNELGVDFAYPTQMGFVGGLDGKAIDPRELPPIAQPAP